MSSVDPLSRIGELLQLGLSGDNPTVEESLFKDLEDESLLGVWDEMKDYRMVRKISNGGMGVVYLAWQKSLERFVAVKFLLPELNQMPQFVERFRREAKAAASLRHPNIVTVHEVGVAGGRTFFSMDFVEGCDLSEVLENGPLPWRRATRYAAIIAETVEFAHSRWVLHRDLKPSNVLIDLENMPHLTDFGLAGKMEVRSHMTLTGHVLGSPFYLSPEQAAGHVDDLGPTCDVYAIGVILYECLTGHPPFQATNVHEMLRMIRETPARISDWRARGIPRDLVKVCLKCLEKDPPLRYPSAGALAEDLHRCLIGDPIRTRFPSFITRRIRWMHRYAKLCMAVLLGGC